jgi:hypothetical protein
MAPRILNLGTRLELSVSRPGRFIPREIVAGTHRMGSWVDHRAGVDEGGNEKNSFLAPAGDQTLIVQSVAL